jgi:NADH:ubiquinone oxidoreductase subunit E
MRVMADLDLAPLQTALLGYRALGRSGLLPALHQAQSIYGYLPEPVVAEIGRTLDVPLAHVL